MAEKTLKHLVGAGLASLVLAGGAMAQAASEVATDPVMFVVDGSNSMWGQLDGVSKIELTRTAFSDVLRTLPSERPAGLVVYGHRRQGDCSDIQLVSQPMTGNRDDLATSVNGISPRGRTPIGASIQAAAEALPQSGGSIVLLSDGVETCDFDPCELAGALEARNINFTVHVIGVDIRRPEDRAALTCIADRTGGTFTDVSSADELGRALQESANRQGDTDVIAPIRIDLSAIDGIEGPFIEDAVFEIIGAADEMIVASNVQGSYDFLPGDYIIVARSGARTGSVEARVLEDEESRTITVVIDADLPDASLNFANPVPAGSVLEVTWSGPDAEGDYIELLDANGERLEDSYFVYTADGTPSLLRVPGTAGEYSLRYVYASRNAPLVSEPLSVTPALAELIAPAEAEVGTFIEVSWTGPDGTNDMIGIYAAGTETSSRAPLSYSMTASGNPSTLQMPGAVGDYEIRYQTGNDMTVLGAVPIRATPANAVIAAEPGLALGDVIEIEVEGTFNPDQDFVTIVTPDSGPSAYNEYVYVSGSETVLLRSPPEVGQYEIRIVRESGDGNEILFRQPIEITPSEASFTAPGIVAAGSEFTVIPTGPTRREGESDVYIAITYPDDGPGAYDGGYDYVNSVGGSVILTAPSEPGTYELRYVAYSGNPMILARQPLIVQ